MPAATVKVDRSIKWGNPFHQKNHGGREGAVEAYRLWADGNSEEAAALRAAASSELGGKSLACWCPLGGPCHADILLKIANSAQ
jgi:hypothetical protein